MGGTLCSGLSFARMLHEGLDAWLQTMGEGSQPLLATPKMICSYLFHPPLGNPNAVACCSGSVLPQELETMTVHSPDDEHDAGTTKALNVPRPSFGGTNGIIVNRRNKKTSVIWGGRLDVNHPFPRVCSPFLPKDWQPVAQGYTNKCSPGTCSQRPAHHLP